MELNKLFTKKEKTEIEKKISSLKKVISKKDELSAMKSIEILKELSENNQIILSNKIIVLSKKHNKFMDSLSAKILRMSNEDFTEEVVKEIIDYCFRFGNADVQRNGVLLLAKFDNYPLLKERYKLVFLKDKTAAKLLQEKIYSKE